MPIKFLSVHKRYGGESLEGESCGEIQGWNRLLVFKEMNYEGKFTGIFIEKDLLE